MNIRARRLAAFAAERPMPSGGSSPGLPQRALAECLATGYLLAVIVGSGVMGDRLSHGDAAFTLLVNSLATGAGLTALILGFGPISGAHLNPVVTLGEACRGALPWAEVPAYVLAQGVGAVCGVVAAHGMFSLPLLSTSRHGRAGIAQIVAEAIATFGLVVVIRGSSRLGLVAVAISVGAYIASAYWFTSSTSFANPAVTLARAWTDTFAGIRPADVPGFVLGQAAGGGAAVLFLGWVQGEGTVHARSEPEE